MKRRAAVLVPLLAGMALACFMLLESDEVSGVQSPAAAESATVDRTQPRSADEITAEIAEQKAAAKADMAARGERYEPGAFPNEWAARQRAYPHNRLNFEQLREARLDARALEMETAGRRGGVWVERGPTNIGARVTDLAIHPTSTNIVYAAMASGGVFR